MRIVKNEVMETEHLVFEPGNCTKYNLLVTNISGDVIIVTDLNRDRVIKFNPVYSLLETIAIQQHLEICGYSIGDAKPMAEMLQEVFEEFN